MLVCWIRSVEVQVEFVNLLVLVLAENTVLNVLRNLDEPRELRRRKRQLKFIRLPFGLYNDINDIDAARVPILLPQSIYPATSRDYLLAQTGFLLIRAYSLGCWSARRD